MHRLLSDPARPSERAHSHLQITVSLPEPPASALAELEIFVARLIAAKINQQTLSQGREESHAPRSNTTG